MASNYSNGHSWDHLDSDACAKAADEIRDLRALLAKYGQSQLTEWERRADLEAEEVRVYLLNK